MKQDIKDKLLSIIILVIGIVGTNPKDIKAYINDLLDEMLA